MTEKLEAALAKGLETARAYRPGQDPEPLLEALGLCLVLAITGRIDALPPSDRSRLRQQGRKALLATPVDDEDLRWAVAIAREGLRALEGETVFDRSAGDPIRPPPARLLAMLRGEPDGISAGACALHVSGCEASREALRTLDLARARPPDVRIAAAAAPEEPMRDPATGRQIASLAAPAVEAVLFEPALLESGREGGVRALAVYAATDVPVRLAGDGLTTRHMLPGYWLGDVLAGIHALDAHLEHGDETRRWQLTFPSDEES
jgi:hypothetical protein